MSTNGLTSPNGTNNTNGPTPSPTSSSASQLVRLDAFRLRSRLIASEELNGSTGTVERCTALAAAPGLAFIGCESGTILACAIVHATIPTTNSFTSGSSTASSSAAGGGSPSRLLSKRKMGKKAIQQMEVIYLRSTPTPSASNAASTINPFNPAPRSSVDLTLPPPARAMLLVLVDSKLLLLDMHSLATVIEIAPKENFSLFAIDQQANSSTPSSSILTSSSSSLSPRIIAAVKGKKKLQLFNVTLNPITNSTPTASATGKAELIKELQLPDSALAMVAQGEMVAIGYKREYSLLNLNTDDPTDVPVPVEGITPLMVRSEPNELLLTTNTGLGFFLSFSGDPLPKAPLVWSQPPVAFAACGGYVLASQLEPSNVPKEPPSVNVSIASLMDQKQVQSVRLPTRLPTGTPPTLLLASHAQADLVLMCVTSSLGSEIFAFAQTSVNEQIEQYMEGGLALEAAQLFRTTNPKRAEIEDFSSRAGFTCLRELEFHHAFETFFPKSNRDPRELIALFPDLTLKGAQFTLPPDSPTLAMGSINQIIDAARARFNVKDKDAALSGPVRRRKEILDLGTATLIRQARLELSGFLWRWRQEHMKTSNSGGTSNSASQDVEIGVCVDTALLFLAVEHESWRAEQLAATPKARNNASGSVTTLAADPTADQTFPCTLSQLFFPSNSCLMHESELFLSRERWYRALALLFQSKGQLRKALETWRNLGEGKFKANDATSSQIPMTSAGTKTGSLIPGLSETVNLLSTMSDQPLLWEFGEWVLATSPVDGLRIFLTPRPDVTTQLPSEKVLTFLKRVAANQKSQANVEKHGGVDGDYAIVGSSNTTTPTTSMSGSQIDLVEAYLEYLISHEKTKESKYHTQLALCYMGKVLKLGLPASIRASATSGSNPTGIIQRFKPGNEPALRGPPRQKLLRFLQRSQDYDAAVVLQNLVELSAKASLDSIGATARTRTASTTTTPGQENIIPTTNPTWTGGPTTSTLGARPSYSGLDPANHESNLYEELLLLLSRLGRHTRVLQIYLFDLRDEAGAAAYAHYISRRTQAEQQIRRESERRAAAQASLDVTGETQVTPVSPIPSSTGGNGSTQMDRHPGDVFLDLLEIYFSEEYAALWRERHGVAAPSATTATTVAKPSTTTTSSTSTVPAPAPTDAALALMDEYFSLMDPVALLRILPPTLSLASLTHLFSRLFPSTLHARRHGRLVSGMHKMVHLRTQAHCFLLRSVSLPLEVGAKCSWCYKALNDSVFVAHPYHVLRDPLTHSYVIDFEHGGIGSSAVHDPFHEQAGFKTELPKFVLVHYQCSAPFLANGGVETYMNVPQQTRTSASASTTNQIEARRRHSTTSTNSGGGGSSVSANSAGNSFIGGGSSVASNTSKSGLTTSNSFQRTKV